MPLDIIIQIVIERYKDKYREAKAALKLSKQQYNDNLSTKIVSPDTNSKIFWKLVKSVVGEKQSASILTLIENGNMVAGDLATANILYQYIAAQTIPQHSDLPLSPFNFLTDARLNTVNISPSIVKRSTYLNVGKANGADDISNWVLSECADSLCILLSIIFTKSVSIGLFPDNWKEVLVTALFKKADKQPKSNYIPISLLSCVQGI